MGKSTTRLRRRQLDKSLSRYRDIPNAPRGYIREIRDALEMSSYQLAERLGVSQPTVMEMEENERSGSASLKTLNRAASALGCKLVYALVPDTSLEQQMSMQVRTRAMEVSQMVLRTMGLERQSTDLRDQEDLIEELSDEILRKGGREIWKSHGK